MFERMTPRTGGSRRGHGLIAESRFASARGRALQARQGVTGGCRFGQSRVVIDEVAVELTCEIEAAFALCATGGIENLRGRKLRRRLHCHRVTSS